MAAGYTFGGLFTRDPEHRRLRLVWLGLGITLLFVVLRALRGYGDPSPFETQDTPIFTLMSFLNTSKYPPSLQYLAMTLGPAIAVLGLLDGAGRGRLGQAFVTLGRVPLFFYVLQWPTARWLGVLFTVLAGKSAEHFFTGFQVFIDPPKPGTGFPLWVVYAQWLLGLALLYQPCRWFAAVKARRKEWWLRYL